jgi:molybdopterin synthase sulfur carrier subunit
MALQIKAFGKARELMGAGTIEVEINKSTTAAELLEHLHSRFPGLDKIIPMNIAVNEEYADAQQIIEEKDEVVLIPPVSGG